MSEQTNSPAGGTDEEYRKLVHRNILLVGFEATDKPFIIRCRICGKEIDSAIPNIIRHWADCTGKEFYEDLMRLLEEDTTNDEKVLMEEMRKLRERYLPLVFFVLTGGAHFLYHKHLMLQPVDYI